LQECNSVLQTENRALDQKIQRLELEIESREERLKEVLSLLALLVQKYKY
jgi:hypothetical protein